MLAGRPPGTLASAECSGSGTSPLSGAMPAGATRGAACGFTAGTSAAARRGARRGAGGGSGGAITMYSAAARGKPGSSSMAVSGTMTAAAMTMAWTRTVKGRLYQARPPTRTSW